jgi:hypothetical protein
MRGGGRLMATGRAPRHLALALSVEVDLRDMARRLTDLEPGTVARSSSVTELIDTLDRLAALVTRAERTP